MTWLFPKTIWIIDIETTWFFNTWGLIVEVWIASLNLETWEIVWIYDSLVKEDSFTESHKNAWIFSNSDLSASEVMEAPSLQSQLPIIQDHINSFSHGITAYNKAFDFTFLKDRSITIAKELPCPMIVATPILKLPSTWYGDHKRPSVEEAWDFLIKSEYDEKHRGLDDALHEAKIVYRLYEMWVFEVQE